MADPERPTGTVVAVMSTGPDTPPSPASGDEPRSPARRRRVDARTIGICVCIALIAGILAGLLVSVVGGGDDDAGGDAKGTPKAELTPDGDVDRSCGPRREGHDVRRRSHHGRRVPRRQAARRQPVGLDLRAVHQGDAGDREGAPAQRVRRGVPRRRRPGPDRRRAGDDRPDRRHLSVRAGPRAVRSPGRPRPPASRRRCSSTPMARSWPATSAR